MKITYQTPDGIVKESVEREIAGYYFTVSGAQISVSAVLAVDNRGGKRANAGRKSLGDDKAKPVDIYLYPKEIEAFEAEAALLNTTISQLLRTKLGL